jgi:hypothetical protein
MQKAQMFLPHNGMFLRVKEGSLKFGKQRRENSSHYRLKYLKLG